MPTEQITYVKNVEAGHAMVTENYGNACAVTAAPYIDDCDYDAAGALLGDQYYGHAGYNRWADTNDIIVLYPQAIARYGWGWPFVIPNFVLNPNACWDWWGYDSRDYYKKSGPQLRAIKGMLDRLGEKRAGS